MNIRHVSHFIALMLLVLGAAVAICWGVSVYYGDPATAQKGLLYSSLTMLAIGGISAPLFRDDSNLTSRDGFGIVTFGWVCICLFGALPYIFSGVITEPIDAFFESMSGFTTTGASVLSDLENLPRGIIFWRSTTHFLGGMGILIMFIAILPFIGTGGVQLYKTEATGLMSEKLTPRIADTARIVFGVYLLLNILCALALRLGGLSWFDATCNAFGAIATGGFSSRTASIGAFESAYVEWVIIFFMFISGINFVLHYKSLRGDLRAYTQSSELKLYASLTLFGCLVAGFFILQSQGEGVSSSIRDGVFQTVSLFSTTGFITADYDLWPLAVKIVFLALMVIGASAGSTSGAIKSIRIVVVAKAIGRQFKSLIYPSSVQAVKLHDTHINNQLVDKAFAYVVAYILTLIVSIFLFSIYAEDIMTATSAVVACLGGVGPGMAGAGPTETYAHFAPNGKLILILCMLLGRLEIYTVLIVFLPSFWKK